MPAREPDQHSSDAGGEPGEQQASEAEKPDPTREPPPAYPLHVAESVYRPAVERCFQFLIGNDMTGDVLEFGTYRGYTTRILAEYMAAREFGGCLYTYDSFEGFPQELSDVDRTSYEVAYRHGWQPSDFKTEPDVPQRIRSALSRVIPPHRLVIVEGFFEDVLEDNLPGDRASLVNMDCDLYGSTLYVLRALLSHEILQDGTLLMFDDYNSNRAHPEMGERRALRDAFAEQTRFTVSQYFGYGWHGQVFFVHDTDSPRALADAVEG